VAGKRKVLVVEDDCVDQVPDPLLQPPVRRDVAEAWHHAGDDRTKETLQMLSNRNRRIRDAERPSAKGEESIVPLQGEVSQQPPRSSAEFTQNVPQVVDVHSLLAILNELQLLGSLLRFESILYSALQHELHALGAGAGELVGRGLILDV